MKKHFIWALCLVGAILGTMSSCEPSGPEEGAEIYAAISADGNILTLYFDAQREKRGGVTDWAVYNNNFHKNPDAETNHVKTIALDRSMTFARPTTTAYWFEWFIKAEAFEHLDYLNTSEVTDMRSMFYNYHGKELDVSHFNTEKVEDMRDMFASCIGIESLDLSHFVTSNVQYMTRMFNGSNTITTLDIRSFDMRKVTAANNMFNICSSLTTIYCNEDLSGKDPEYTTDMFNHCTSLVGGKGTKFDKNHTGGEYAKPDGTNGEKGYFTGCATELYAAFDAGSSTLTLYYDNLKETRSQVMYLDKMTLPQRHAVKTVEIDPSLDDYYLYSTERWFANMTGLETVKGLEYLNRAGLNDVSYMFMNCTSLKTIDLKSFGFIGAKKDAMFIGCSALTTIICSEDYSTSTQDFSSSQMFNGCTSLVGGKGTKYSDAHMDASYARPDDPTNGKPGYFTKDEIFAMVSDDGGTLTFYFHKDPKDLPGKLTKWNESMGSHFNIGCFKSNIKKIVLDESVKEARPIFIGSWFCGFHNLETIEHLEYLNTSEVIYMAGLFEDIGIKVIDLTCLDTRKVRSFNRMFAGCSSLTTIYCNDDWSQRTNLDEDGGMGIFLNATRLVGEKGTKYDANHTGIEYARPDGLDGKPGYFTRK